MKKKRIPALSVVLYALSGVLALYMVWAVYQCQKYLSTMIAQGQIVVKGNLYGLVNFYMTNSSQYLLFAVILFALGFILQHQNSLAAQTSSDGVKTDYSVVNTPVVEVVEEETKKDDDLGKLAED